MNHAVVMDLARHGITVALMVTLPILAVSLFVGLTVSVFQALTQVQEMTLTFVPKAAAMLAVFWLSMSFMTNSLVSFFTDTLIPQIAGG